MSPINIDRDAWEAKLGDVLCWDLSFEDLREKERTKHVHRLHPYKGKFIPQLVEYFLKKYFHEDDIILDPFCGSGTTMVQALEMGMNGIGVDVSKFNCMIAEAKLYNYDIHSLRQDVAYLKREFNNHKMNEKLAAFDEDVSKYIRSENKLHFPKGTFKSRLKDKGKDIQEYIKEHEMNMFESYANFMRKHRVFNLGYQGDLFIDQWYTGNIREEMDVAYHLIDGLIMDEHIKNLMNVVLCRTIRSCRATKHIDLGTLKHPTFLPYYCKKHSKICKPLYTMKPMFNRYLDDTITRLKEYDPLVSHWSRYAVLQGDARTMNILDESGKYNPYFKGRRAKGIFTSPPYIGQIDYHEQHRYAYELLELKREDDNEIGSLSKGQSSQAKKDYIQSIAAVLENCKKSLMDDYDVFIVANDKFNLYEDIAESANMKIVNQIKRPVLARMEDRNPYCETIFHLKDNT